MAASALEASAKTTVALLLAACTAASPVNRPPEPRALGGDLRDASRRVVGRVDLIERGESTLIRVRVEGISPGEHGIHLHSQPRCDPPDFATAGDHFNPLGNRHGMLNEAGPHAGDLPNIVVRPDSTGTLNFTTARISLQPDRLSSFDAARGSLVLHAGRDDQRTDPSGQSGARIACALLGAADGRRTAR